MPMFDYVCSACGAEFEELVRKPDETVSCPECGAAQCLRQLAKVAFSVGAKFVASTGSGACSGCSATSCSSCSTGS